MGLPTFLSKKQGLGWFVSKDKVAQSSFLLKLFRKAKEREALYYQDDLTIPIVLLIKRGDVLGG